MIPYVEVATLHLGRFSAPIFLVLVVTAVAVASAIIVVRGHRLGLPYERTEELCLWAAVAGAVGAHLFRYAYVPQLFARVLHNPRLIFGAGISSFGGFFGGLAGVYGFFWRRKVGEEDRRRFMDVAAFALPFSWVFGRIGCALVHDHPGLRTSSWLGVQFPGGTRYDLGLLEVFFLIALAALFLILNLRPRPAGFYFGWFFVLYGVFRIGLDQLHVDPPRYFGFSVDEYSGAAALLLGLASIGKLWRSAERDRAMLDGSLSRASKRA